MDGKWLFNRWTIGIISLALVWGCCFVVYIYLRTNKPFQPKAITKFEDFSRDQVCNYPGFSSIAEFRSLAGGTWRESIVGNQSFGWGCMTGNSSDKIVYLFGSGASKPSILVEYSAMGDEQGVVSLAADYSATGYDAIPIEADFRERYTTFLDELLSGSLKQPLPEKAKAEIRSLSSYPAIGVRNSTTIDAGSGSVRLSRNANRQDLLVRCEIFANR